MRFEKFTNRLQQTLSDAQSLAMSRDHASIDGIHILATLMEETSNVSLLQQAGANLRELQTKLETALSNAATLSNPSADINLSPEAAKVLHLADSYAQKAGDEFLSTDWVLLALAETGNTKNLLSSAGVKAETLRQIINQFRGDEKVMSNNHEDQRDSLNKYTIDLTERALAGKLDPVIGRDDLHPHMIDLGCGKKWSCCNVGANSPEEYGTYFSWGETYPKNSYTKDTYSLRSVEDGKEYYQLMGSSSEGISGTQYDAATMNWGSIWATPQNSDYNALLSNCQFELYNYNGVSGVRVLGPSGNSIFLPAAGCKEGSSLYGAGTNGYYWSSSWPINENGLVIGAAGPTMYYDSTQIGLDLFYRYYGFSVRPVSR